MGRILGAVRSALTPWRGIFGSSQTAKELERLREALRSARTRETDLERLYKHAQGQYQHAAGQYQHAAGQLQHAQGELRATREELARLQNTSGCPDAANRLFFLFGLPKSAGQALRAILNRCRVDGPQQAMIPQTVLVPNGLHVEMPLTDRILNDFPAGGWFHTHAPATLITLDFLRRHRIRHIVLFRHPLDQIVAYYCHVRKHTALGHPTALPWNPALSYTNPQAPIPPVAFTENTPIDDAFAMLIRQGYLEAVLLWIGQWCVFQDPELSQILTYEQLTAQPVPTVAKLVSFLHPMLAVPAGGIEEAIGSLSDYAHQSHELDSRLSVTAYPRGYSGEVGVYRRYLSEANIQLATEVFERFCRDSVYGPALRRYYPELTSEPGR